MDARKIKFNFELLFHHKCDAIIDCGGRFEVLGNHTDHNHGMCIAATCDLKISAAVKKTNGLLVDFYSYKNKPFKLDLSDLSVKEDEYSTSQGLIRGIAFYLKEHGYNIGGFETSLFSTIFPGAGVSSSAAFELLIGKIFNHFYNDDKIDTLTLAKAGKFSENNYFNKASGLLDQIGVGFGGLSWIDFKDIENPVVTNLKPDFKDLHFVIVNTGGSHAHLSHLYSAIPNDMYSAAKKLGVNFLRETSEEALEKYHSENPGGLTDMEYNRAKHFFGENKRVEVAFNALQKGDLETFLAQVNASKKSSEEFLKNMMVEDQYKGSPLEACDLANKTMENTGACKINGGGFAGSIICIVKDSYLNKFLKVMRAKYGRKNVVEVHVRDIGPSVVE